MRIDTSKLLKTTPIERALEGYIHGSKRRVLALTDGMIGFSRMWGYTDNVYSGQWTKVHEGQSQWGSVMEPDNRYERWWWK